MLRKVFALVISLLATIMTTSAQTPPNNEIWYTTTDGETISISFDTDDLVSHNYNNGRGVLKFRNSVTSIEDCAFYGCSGLTSITIPENVTWIGNNALNCYNLESITCKAMTPPTISFPGIGDKVIIYVPKDAVKAYKKDKNWMQYSKRIKRIKE